MFKQAGDYHILQPENAATRR